MSRLSILLTGGPGQAGSNIYGSLWVKGNDVFILDSLATPDRPIVIYKEPERFPTKVKPEEGIVR